MLNIVCTSKPGDGLLFYSYEYCSHLNDKGISTRLCVIPHRDFTSGDYTQAISDKYIHCKNVEFNNIFVGDSDVSMVLGRSMISLAHMTWNDYNDIQRTSLKKLFKNKIISVYSENHPTIYPEALMRFNPDWVIDLCDTDVYPNGVGEHFEKIIHFPIYKEVKEDIQFNHLFLGTNKEYYNTVQKVISDYPDHGIMTYPKMDVDPANNNIPCPIPNLLSKFKTYVYTKDTFDPAPRLFQEARWLGKEIIYHRTNPVQDGGYWYWKRGLKNQDIGPIITALNTFDGKIAIDTELASANHREQIGNLDKANTVDFSITSNEIYNNIEYDNIFFCSNPYSSPVNHNGKYAPCKIAKPSNKKYKSIESWLKSKELHKLRTDMLNGSHPFLNDGKEFNNKICAECIKDPSKRNTNINQHIIKAATRTKLNLPYKLEGRYLELEVSSNKEIDLLEKLSQHILKLKYNGGELRKLEQWEESKNIELITNDLYHSKEWKKITVLNGQYKYKFELNNFNMPEPIKSLGDYSSSSENQKFIKTLQESPTFWCPHFFDHIHTNTSGKYSVCCVGQPTDIKFTDVSPMEWYYGDILTSCRKSSIGIGTEKDREVMEENCSACIKAESRYGKSERTDNITSILLDDIAENWKSPAIVDVMKAYISTGEVLLKPGLIRLQLRIFGNTCNLDCYMCQPHNSSVREAHVNKSDEFDILFGRNYTNKSSKSRNFNLDNLDEIIPYIKTVTLQGGEPLFIKNQYKLLDKLVQMEVSENIVIDMNTNGTMLGVGKYNILDYVKKFKQLQICISLDGVGKYNEYIRRRSLWNDIDNNINTLIRINDEVSNKMMEDLEGIQNKIDISVFSTVSLLSILRMDKLIDWCKDKGLTQTLFVVDDPAELSASNLPESIKKELRIRYSNNKLLLSAIDNKETNSDYDEKTNFSRAIKYIKKTDKEYNTDVFEIYPELRNNLWQN